MCLNNSDWNVKRWTDRPTHDIAIRRAALKIRTTLELVDGRTIFLTKAIRLLRISEKTDASKETNGGRPPRDLVCDLGRWQYCRSCLDAVFLAQNSERGKNSNAVKMNVKVWTLLPVLPYQYEKQQSDWELLSLCTFILISFDRDSSESVAESQPRTNSFRKCSSCVNVSYCLLTCVCE